jgi:hypothetical protein
MQVSYGPPGQRGVTHLMAVGDDAIADADPLESALVLGAIATGAAQLFGAPKKIVGWGGLAVAAIGIAVFVRKKTRTVTVAAAVAPPAAGW